MRKFIGFMIFNNLLCSVSNKPRKSIGSVQEKARERVREEKKAENDKTKKEGSDSDSDSDSDEESIGISDVNVSLKGTGDLISIYRLRKISLFLFF